MFANAYKKAAKFTFPVIVSQKTFKGEVHSGCGAFILLNKDGWILTVAHIFQARLQFHQHKAELDAYKVQVEQIHANTHLNEEQKRKALAEVARNDNWITNESIWWGDTVDIDGDSAKADLEADLAVARIKNFNPSANQQYAKFKDPGSFEIGEFVCKLGFPLYKVNSTFDEAQKSFILGTETFPIPRFPIEGMFTRNIVIKSDKTEVKFLETSTPGLRGQSGGPIFDKDGNVWALQSKTQHFPLEFSPVIEVNGKKFEEQQFLNVGWGVHGETIINFLKQHRIEFELAK